MSPRQSQLARISRLVSTLTIGLFQHHSSWVNRWWGQCGWICKRSLFLTYTSLFRSSSMGCWLSSIAGSPCTHGEGSCGRFPMHFRTLIFQVHKFALPTHGRQQEWQRVGGRASAHAYWTQIKNAWRGFMFSYIPGGAFRRRPFQLVAHTDSSFLLFFDTWSGFSKGDIWSGAGQAAVGHS